MKIYTYRFMWKLVDSDSVNFKIITDTEEGLKQFEDTLLQIKNLESAAKEYINEIDCSKIAVYENIKSKEISE